LLIQEQGVFRKACEITLDLLRENQQTLMSVLDAFIHDPLVEWEDEKKRNVSAAELFRQEITFTPHPGVLGTKSNQEQEGREETQRVYGGRRERQCN
jgi:phosphatidylinositol kinase/protein kinase (PI-3  family)